MEAILRGIRETKEIGGRIITSRGDRAIRMVREISKSERKPRNDRRQIQR